MSHDRRGRRALAAAALALAGTMALSACGFRPLYGRNDSPASADLAAVQVSRIPDRIGQQLRIRLQDRFDSAGEAAKAYTLSVDLKADSYATVIRPDATPSRNNFDVVAVYVLRDNSSGKVLTYGQSRAVTSYNTLFSDYATTSAEADARSRVVDQLAADIQTRLAVWFDQQPRKRVS